VKRFSDLLQESGFVDLRGAWRLGHFHQQVAERDAGSVPLRQDHQVNLLPLGKLHVIQQTEISVIVNGADGLSHVCSPVSSVQRRRD
jgi:hypothetical protein